MSMLYAYKPQKDRFLLSISRALFAAGVTPNMITVSGLLISGIAGALAMSGHFYAAIILFFAGACLDALDGSFARVCGLCTEFGKYFDSCSDRCSEFLLVIGAVLGGVPVYAFLVVAGSVILLASRVYNHRKGLDSNAALFGRPERLTLLMAGLLSPEPYNAALFMTAFVICVISSAQVLASGADRKAIKLIPVAGTRK